MEAVPRVRTLTYSSDIEPERDGSFPREPVQRNAAEHRLQQQVTVAGISMLPDLSGALLWEEQRLLVVSDLHLEKGSNFALRGVLLPPYDTVATLGRLATVIARHNPKVVLALGDRFHD